jgi:opacity protein-like surface antigen
MRKVLVACACIALISDTAVAADLPVKATPYVAPAYNWTGFYIGAQAGYGWTTQSMSATDRAAIIATYGAVPSPKGFIGGLHAGYDWQLPSRFVIGLGLEANGFGIDAFNSTTGLAGTSLKSTIDWDVALYGRVGYAFDRFLPYVLVGAAWDHNKVSGNNGFIGSFAVNNWHSGWTVGAGVEAVLVEHRF